LPSPIGPGPFLGETMTPLIRVCGRFFVALVGLAGRDSRVRGAGLVAALPLVLSSALVSVPPLAYGSAPAPILMTGIYDNADPDELMIDGAGASRGQRPGQRAESHGTSVLLCGPGQIPSEVRSAEIDRGPPTAVAIPITRSFRPSSLPHRTTSHVMDRPRQAVRSHTSSRASSVSHEGGRHGLR